MTNKEKAKKIEDLLKNQDIFKVKSVLDINHRPHPYTIGPNHIKNSNGGFIDKNTLKNTPCAHPGCRISYEEHTSDNVCFLQFIRNCTNEEANITLKELVEALGNSFIDKFAFVESDFKVVG